MFVGKACLSDEDATTDRQTRFDFRRLRIVNTYQSPGNYLM